MSGWMKDLASLDQNGPGLDISWSDDGIIA